MQLRLNNFVVLSALFLTVCDPISSQQATSNASNADSFVGTWKFNPKKSSQTGTADEQIKIERQDGKYKLAFDSTMKNGAELRFSYLTSMNGETLRPSLDNGQPMSQEERVVRTGADSFKIESKMEVQHFKVSKDGKKLKLERKLLGLYETLVFDRE
jgi:hypothetical protein